MYDQVLGWVVVLVLVRCVSFIFRNHHTNMTKTEDLSFAFFQPQSSNGISTVYVHKKQSLQYIKWNCKIDMRFNKTKWNVLSRQPKH